MTIQEINLSTSHTQTSNETTFIINFQNNWDNVKKYKPLVKQYNGVYNNETKNWAITGKFVPWQLNEFISEII